MAAISLNNTNFTADANGQTIGNVVFGAVSSGTDATDGFIKNSVSSSSDNISVKLTYDNKWSSKF
jgi:hypothetical protein